MNCEGECSNCTMTATNCTACILTTQIPNNLGVCVDRTTVAAPTSCPAGKYLEGTECKMCDPLCATCARGGSSNCLTCATHAFEVNMFGTVKQCSAACLTGQRLIKTPSVKCSYCVDMTYDPFNQACVASCPLKTFAVNLTSTITTTSMMV
jgi:hypothetical protein